VSVGVVAPSHKSLINPIQSNPATNASILASTSFSITSKDIGCGKKSIISTRVARNPKHGPKGDIAAAAP
ncbi:MAG: hypothetical protein ACREOZ_03645, partial [Gloeomargaritales cyanobacterium]